MRKKIIKIGSIVSAVIMGLALIILPFSGKIMPNAYNLICSADETVVSYNYYGSSWLTLGICDNTKYTFVNSRVNFQTLNDTTDIQFYCKQWVVDDNAVATYGTAQYGATGYWTGSTYHGSSLVNTDSGLYSSNFSLSGAVSNYWLRMVRMPVGSAEYVVICRFERSAGFSGNVSYIRISAVDYDGNSYSQFGQGFTKLIQVGYYDANDNYLTYSFPTINEYASDFTTRTYYVSDTSSNEYNDGFDRGYSNGYTAGQSEGYSSGYGVGQNVGYNNGFSAGVASANDYSFLGLIGAVVDVPVQTFTNLFNFQLLGINLAGFFTGLLTLAFIITIVKLLL